ncbi:hypothetical protein CNR34_00136 [Pseudomonas phage nickie]|uniref:Uncharacterized protein n=1 Tax=Pseudomonas phage nickie TaxID=2048977 RepID=A0A2H4P7C3_9CAUD|nr:hypothetical protein FDJ16_gp029 [Pseudomonas phage nickie]ATW58069.1 hypothetical protein CNR34_00136 [Pseudomonas phage nickie]
MNATARKTNNNANNVVPMGQTNRAILTFADLVVGDRFQPIYAVGKQYPIYTKTRHDQARCHSVEGIQLKKKGHGYLDDPIVSVSANEKIRFIPVGE